MSTHEKTIRIALTTVLCYAVMALVPTADMASTGGIRAPYHHKHHYHNNNGGVRAPWIVPRGE